MKTVKIPERMCIACREMKPKKELLRIVRTPDERLLIDKGGRQNGRGAYLCRSCECLNKSLKSKALERAFKTALPAELIAEIKAEIAADNHA